MSQTRKENREYSIEYTDVLNLLINDKYCDIESCMQAIKAGANPNTQNDNGKTVLHIAAEKMRTLIPSLLEFGADPTIKDNDGSTALLLTLESMSMYHYEFAIALVRHGADPNTANILGQTLLHELARYKPELIAELLQLGANPNIRDKKGKTPLNLFLTGWSYRYIEAIELICAGANVFTESDANETLETKIKKNNSDKTIFDIALEKKPELLLKLQSRQIIPENPEAILKKLLDKGHLDIAFVLIQSYEKFEALNSNGETILQIALSNDPSLISSLLKLGCNPAIIPENQKSVYETLLSKNCLITMDEKIQIGLTLIQHGADANLVNENNENILQLIYNQYPTVVKEIAKLTDNQDDYLKPHIIFKLLNIAEFKLKLRYLSATHQARNNILNFIILLAFDLAKEDQSKRSIFSILPNEIMVHIISFINLDATKKTLDETFGLMNFIYDNVTTIKKMAKTPGCVSIFQEKQDGTNTFTLFKSATNLCLYYRQKKMELSTVGINQTNLNSALKLEEIKKNYAVKYWVCQSSLYKKQSSKLALAENIEDTELYRDVKALSKPKNV